MRRVWGRYGRGARRAGADVVIGDVQHDAGKATAEELGAAFVPLDVTDDVSTGLPDDRWGERVTVVLELHAGRSVSPEELREFVKGRVGSVKTPKQVEVWPELPRSKVGKVLKTEVRQLL